MFRTTLTVLAAVVLFGVTSATAVAQQDLRMPDTRDAAIAATQTQDLRGPDAQDAARADQIAAQMRALRTRADHGARARAGRGPGRRHAVGGHRRLAPARVRARRRRRRRPDVPASVRPSTLARS